MRCFSIFELKIPKFAMMAFYQQAASPATDNDVPQHAQIAKKKKPDPTRVYEWDSQHGELETYRASDGEHPGSVDHKTGEQLKPAVKGRIIKRYL
jgi:N-acetyl-anhydromuramyl-L-alanine amidase AmpD